MTAKEKKILKIALIVAVAIVIAFGIFLINKHNASQSELTDEQKTMLEQIGVTGDYNDLSDSEKKSLTVMQDALNYINEKYSCEAEYVSFELDEKGTKHTLIVNIEGHTVTVTVFENNDSYRYKDDYATQILATPYNVEINKYFTDNSIKAIAYTELEEVNGSLDEIISTDGKAEDRDTLLGSVTASNCVFVAGVTTQDELKAIAEKYAEWYKPQLSDSSNVTRFYMVDNITSITDYKTFAKTVSDENRVMCVITVDGTIDVVAM